MITITRENKLVNFYHTETDAEHYVDEYKKNNKSALEREIESQVEYRLNEINFELSEIRFALGKFLEALEFYLAEDVVKARSIRDISSKPAFRVLKTYSKKHKDISAKDLLK